MFTDSQIHAFTGGGVMGLIGGAGYLWVILGILGNSGYYCDDCALPSSTQFYPLYPHLSC